MKILNYIFFDLNKNYLHTLSKRLRLQYLLSWLIKKSIQINKRLINAIWAIPFVVIIRIIRPIKVIKIGQITSHRIGHFISDAWYEIIIKKTEKNSEFVIWATTSICNYAWYKIIKRHLFIRTYFESIYYWNSLIPGGKHHSIDTLKHSRDKFGKFEQNSFRVLFSKKETNFCLDWLKSYGWQENEQFICILNRDSKYLRLNSHFATGSFQPPNFYDYHSYRNSSIATFEKSIEYLLQNNFWVIRMGREAEEKIRIKNSKLIDYPFETSKSDLLDIWLFSNCTGCISTGSGIDYLSWIQRIPSLVLNYIPIKYVHLNFNCITVPKNLYWKQNLKELKLSEYLNQSYFNTNDYLRHDIVVKDLNDDEILDAVKEFILRLKGFEIIDEIDDVNQKKFKEILKTQEDYNQIHGFINKSFKIGNTWLKTKDEKFFS